MSDSFSSDAPQGNHHADLKGIIVKLLGDAEEALASDCESARASLAEAMSLLNVDVRPERKTSTAPHGGLAGWQVKRVTAYVDEHLGSTIRAKDLADVARLSLSHFQHAFKQTFDETPLAYVGRRRLERALERMLNSDEPLSLIALECGYYDQPHFTRSFHRAMGISPQTWRRRYASDPAVSRHAQAHGQTAIVTSQRFTH